MKLLDHRKITPYMNEVWQKWSKEIVGEQPMGDYYVFSDGGRFRGVTMKGNKEAAAIGGMISVNPSDYKLAKVKEVKYLSFPFNELSSRWQNEVAFLLRGKNKAEPWPDSERNRSMQHLHKSNPCVVFSLVMEPLYFSGGEKGCIDLQNGQIHTKPFPVEETLPCVYKTTDRDLLYDLSEWETRNKKGVRVNFAHCMAVVRAGKEDMILALDGHLLMAFSKDEIEVPANLDTEHFVHAAFTPDVICVLSVKEIMEGSDDTLYTKFLAQIQKIGYAGLYHKKDARK